MEKPRGTTGIAENGNRLEHEATVIASLGNPNFYDELSCWMFSFLEKPDVSRFALSHLIRDQRPQFIYDVSPSPKVHSGFASFLEGAYLLDPVYRYALDCIENGKSGFFPLKEIAPDDFLNSEYYKRYYLDEGEVQDNVDFVVALSNTSALAISLGKLAGCEPYSEEVLLRLKEISPVVNALLKKHWEKGKEDSEETTELHRQFKQAYDRFGISVLTERERELVHLMLLGYSQIAAAEILGVKPGTVKMHRKNIYTKLEVSTHAELFALFLDALKFYDGKADDPLKNL